jgi:hypothetical protein
MKIFKTAVLAALMVSGVAIAAHATDLVISGEVDSISTLDFSGVNPTLPDYLNTNAVSAATVGQVRIDNNDPQGFKISMHSEKGGKLTRYNVTNLYYDSTVPGNAVAYTITMVPGSGILGTVENTAFISPDIALTSNPVDYNFSSGVNRATVAKLYDMNLKLNAGTAPDFLFKSSQTGDYYRDTIIVTMADL